MIPSVRRQAQERAEDARKVEEVLSILKREMPGFIPADAPKKLVLQDAKTDPNGNPFPFAVLYRSDFGSYANSTVERFATKPEAVARGKFFTKQGLVVDVFEDVAYTVGAGGQ